MNIGGLAIPSGVAIAAPAVGRLAVALRAPDGGLEVRVLATPPVAPWARCVPVLRGVAAVAASVGAGLRAVRLMSGSGPEVRPADAVLAASAALVAALVLFVWLPWVVSGALGLPWADGAVRAMLVAGWLWGLRMLPAGREMYAYHAAEHKVVNAWEALGRIPLPEEAAAFSDRHPRCGFGLLSLVVVLAALVMPVVPPLVRPLVLPLLAGAGYELLGLGPVRRLALFAQGLVLAPCGREHREHLEAACAALRAAVGEGVA
jgi:uncharacterized protein YqhQ